MIIGPKGHSLLPLGMRTPSRRQFMAGAGAAGLGAMALPSLGRAQAPTKGGRLRIGSAEGSTTDSLDPATYTQIFNIMLGFATHGTLTEIAPNGELVGDLAETIEASDDASVWTFRLRSGVEFSDGRTLRAEDAIASLNHHRGEESKSGVKSLVDPITEINKIDDLTFAVQLEAGNADFPYLMADYHLIIMPSDDEGNAIFDNGYIGTGGYILQDFDPGVRAFVTRNPNYWKPDRAHVDEIEIIVLADTGARQNALLTGDVDVISRVDLKTVGLMSRRPDVRVEETTGFLHHTAPMITTNSPYDNNELRLAIKHGINREELVEKILLGHGVMGNDQPIAPSVPFWADLEQRTYDPDKAKFHLKNAGYDSIDLDLSAADAAYPGAVDAAVLMKEHLAAANINVNVIREPNDGYWSNVWLKKDWCQCYWGGRPTCDWMFSNAYAEGVAWNDSYWSNERFNELLLQGRAEVNPDNRANIYREMQEIVKDDGGVVVWGFANYVFAMNDKVQHGPDMAANWDLDGGRCVERWWLT